MAKKRTGKTKEIAKLLAKPEWTTGDMHRFIGVGNISRVTVSNAAKERLMHLCLTGRGHWLRFPNNETVRGFCEDLKRARDATVRIQAPRRRAYRKREQRQKRVEALDLFLSRRHEISARDKRLALDFCECLWVLDAAKHGIVEEVTLCGILRGIEAYFERGGFYPDELHERIEQLPTRPAATPQTEQSSLNASAQ
jgi:hypothetical protein